jgi:hypothetical protein
MKALCVEGNCDTWSQALRHIDVMTTSEQHITVTAIYIRMSANIFGNYLTTH